MRAALAIANDLRPEIERLCIDLSGDAPALVVPHHAGNILPLHLGEDARDLAEFTCHFGKLDADAGHLGIQAENDRAVAA